MTRRESGSFAVTSKSVAGLAIVFLVLAAFFGFLNIQKVKALRTNAANAQLGRDEAVRSHELFAAALESHNSKKVVPLS